MGEAVENTLKGGGTEKRGGETKILKRGKAGSRGGCLKKGMGGGLEPPYELCHTLDQANRVKIKNESLLFLKMG